MTLEVAWEGAKNMKMVDWFFKTYYVNEDLGFSYSQLGQENSFAPLDLVTPLKMQVDLLREKYEGIKFLKMCDAGAAFKEKYAGKTPATAVSALDNWDDEDVQSVYYDCENYVANIFRHEDKLFLRAFYLFDERVKEHYLESPCTRFDAVYENLPIVDTVIWTEGKKDEGLMIDEDAKPFEVQKVGDSSLLVKTKEGEKKALFTEEKVEIYGEKLKYLPKNPKAAIKVEGNAVNYEYQGMEYALETANAEVSVCRECGAIVIKRIDCAKPIELIPRRK